jgi:hypothetical protein
MPDETPGGDEEQQRPAGCIHRAMVRPRKKARRNWESQRALSLSFWAESPDVIYTIVLPKVCPRMVKRKKPRRADQRPEK